jgi:sarcosine oxidase delta subunit
VQLTVMVSGKLSMMSATFLKAFALKGSAAVSRQAETNQADEEEWRQGMLHVSCAEGR